MVLWFLVIMEVGMVVVVVIVVVMVVVELVVRHAMPIFWCFGGGFRPPSRRVSCYLKQGFPDMVCLHHFTIFPLLQQTQIYVNKLITLH